MRWREIIREQKPLTPEQANKRAEKLRKAQRRLQAAQASCGQKIAAARQSLADL
jgi:hypothetical protein